MSTMERMFRQELVKGLVQRKITCLLTGAVLDYRKCGVVLDTDGDPNDVFHESAVVIVQELLKDTEFTVAVAPFTGKQVAS